MSGMLRWMTAPAMATSALLADTLAVLRRQERYRDVPALAPNASLVVEALLDGSFTTLVSMLVGVPDPHQVRRGHQELLAMRDFLAERGWYDDPARYHRAPPALRTPQRVERVARGLGGSTGFAELTFESGYEPHPGEPGRERWLSNDDNTTAVAYVLEHVRGDRPWLVCVHGFGMGQPTTNIQGLAAEWVHRELGLNVLMPVLPLHGPRSSTRFSGGGLLQPEYTNVMHLFSQAVWDIRRLVGWIRDRSDRPIGLHGISLGGYTVALASAFIEDLACVIAGIPAVDFTSVARENEPWIYQAYGGDLQTDWALVTEAMYPVSPLTYEPRLPVEGRFVYAGVGDRITKPDQARALWRHWGKPRIDWMPSGHVMATMKSELRPILRGIVADRLFAPGAAPFETDAPRAAGDRNAGQHGRRAS